MQIFYVSNMLQNELLIAKIGFDTAENETSEIAEEMQNMPCWACSHPRREGEGGWEREKAIDPI